MKCMIRAVLGGVVVAIVSYVIWGAIASHRYAQAFDETHVGQSLNEILEKFGPPSYIEPHREIKGYDAGERSLCAESCWLRLWYEIPFTLGTAAVTVDFNAGQKVIHKYQWSSP